MSLLSPAARQLANITKANPKPLPRVGPQAQPGTQAPAQARPLDTFTPSLAQGRLPPSRPEINPQGERVYSEPQEADQLPDPAGTGVLTLNTANGVQSGRYRDGDDRQRQADFIKATGASIVALQEVDVGVDRTQNVNTALDIIRRNHSSFDVFTDPNAKVPRVDIGQDAPETAIREGRDGTTLYQTPEGTLVTGESFSGDDREGGVDDDTDKGASYGNALFVAAPNKVSEAYTVALPSSLNKGAPSAPSEAQLAALADGKLTDAERTQLEQSNEAIRDDPNGEEPRSALVTRVVGPDGRETTYINTHTAAGEGSEQLRQDQLAYIAQLAEAESKGPPAREVVVLGDLNDSTGAVDAAFDSTFDGGLNRTVGGDSYGRHNFDQIWTTGGLNTTNSAQVATHQTISDHENAGYTVIT
jgi:endonuclease/exonuclease/phosphatase family metal-dependent hydrolase